MFFSICAPVAFLYARPSPLSEVVSQAIYGWTAQELDVFDSFKRVRMEDGYEGWIETNQLVSYAPGSLYKAKTLHNAAHLYCEPNLTKRKPCLTVPFEVELDIVGEPLEEESRWIRIKLLDGSLAWIQRVNVSIGAAPLTLFETLKLSQQFIGLPYTWGGVSSFGYDCSGFIQMLFRQRGIILPRDARQQIQDARFQSVDSRDIEPGDVLFFGRSLDSINHVGLYLKESRFIHASAYPAPLVQISHLNDSGLSQRYRVRFIKRLTSSIRHS